MYPENVIGYKKKKGRRKKHQKHQKKEDIKSMFLLFGLH